MLMKKLRFSLFTAVGTLLMAMTSCSPYTLVNSEVYNNADMASFHTFHIITPDEGKLPPGMELVTYYNIAAAIREQMIERGYTEDPTSPFIINIGITVQREIQTEPLAAVAPMPPMGPPPYGPNFFPYGGPGPAPAFAPYFMMPRQIYWTNPNAQVITGIYKEGVLTMDIVDMQNKTAVFSASVSTILTNGDSQFRNLSGIAEAVQTLFKDYPVPLLPQYQKQKK